MNVTDICRIVMKNISNFKITMKIEKKRKFRKISKIFDFFNFGGPLRFDFRNQHARKHNNSPTPINSTKKSLIRPTLWGEYVMIMTRNTALTNVNQTLIWPMSFFTH